jgi:membrane carboxypeptidase/penicillin-binding protein PbpC
MQKVGVPIVTQLAQNLSITTLSGAQDHNLAIALGAGEVSLLELTNAYATFGATGLHQRAQFALRVIDKQEKDIPLKQPATHQAISPETAFLVSSILSDDRARAEIFGRSLTISHPAAVKTGTSQDYRDAWTIGYTPQVAVGVWIGNNDNKPMQALAGALGAAPVWKQIMEGRLKEQTMASFTPPTTIEEVTLCRRLTPSPTPDGQSSTEPPKVITYKEYFLAGTAPKSRCLPTTAGIVRSLTNPASDVVTQLH